MAYVKSVKSALVSVQGFGVRSVTVKQRQPLVDKFNDPAEFLDYRVSEV